MDKKFQPLDYSRGWDDYWRDHPQGYSPQEQMINWSGQLNAMIDFFNEYFGVDLTEYATNVMEGWYFDGRLDEIINEALFNSKADKTTVNSIVDRLAQKYINVYYPPSPLEGIVEGENPTTKIQAMLDYLDNNGGGTLYFPKGTYLIENINAEYGLKVYRHIKLKGAGMNNTIIRANSDMTALVGSDEGCDYFETESIGLDANNKADHALELYKEYSPYLSIVNTIFNQAKEDAVKLATYMSVFTKSITQLSKNGWTIWGKTGLEVNTSLTFNSCYANNMAEKGYNIRAITYSSFNSCAADSCGNAYYFYDAKGVTLNGSGCEVCKQPLNVYSGEGMSINGFYMLKAGDDVNPPDYLMEFRRAVGVTISGAKVDMYGSTRDYFNYVLGVTEVGTGNENISITDNSIRKEDVSYPLNSEYSKMNAVNFLADHDKLSFYAIKGAKTHPQWYKITKLKYDRANSDRAYFMGSAMTSCNFGNSKKTTSKIDFSFAIGDGTDIKPLFINYGDGYQASGLWCQIHKNANDEYILFMRVPAYSLSTVLQFDSSYCYHLFEEYHGDFSEYTNVWDSYSTNVQDMYIGSKKVVTEV